MTDAAAAPAVPSPRAGRLRVMTIVGTRPEIIRLSALVALLEEHTDHVLVHTGQNHDPQLSQVFFDGLGVREPDHYLGVATTSLAATIGDVLLGTERLVLAERPDAVVILGDTNSCLAALMARRMKVPVYHLEAGNRSFDPNVPEEINRLVVDHVADYNLVYSEHSRRNLLAEGLHPSRVLLVGSPMAEVLAAQRDAIAASDALERLDLERGRFVVASLHREENVDHPVRLRQALAAVAAVGAEHGVPVIMSTHPRTRRRMVEAGVDEHPGIVFHEPLGFADYVALQQAALVVLSDSGTIAEEAAILGFPAVTMRDAIERPEAVDAGGIVLSGVEPGVVVDAVRIALDAAARDVGRQVPAEYTVTDTSWRALTFIRSTAATHHARAGIRR